MIRRQRTPTIIDNGHGWRNDAAAWGKADAIAVALRFPKGWADDYCGKSSFTLCPMDIIRAGVTFNTDVLEQYFLDDGKFVYGHVVNDVQCEDLGDLIGGDMTAAQKHHLGTLWLNKTNATRTVLTCQREGRNAPEGIVVYERTLKLRMEEKTFWLDYHVELHHVYVVSGSRGNSIGHALVAPIALEFYDDIRHLRRSFDKINGQRLGKLELGFTLGGDLASEGGAALYQGLRSSMCEQVEETFTERERHRFFVTTSVEERSEYTFFDPDAPPTDRVRSLPENFTFR